MNFALYVISAGRPDAVGRMAPHLATVDAPKRWVVPKRDADAYYEAGAIVVEDPGTLVGARNLALAHVDREFALGNAARWACVQVSDDLKRIRSLTTSDQGEHGKADVSLGWALSEMDAALDDTGLALCGCSPTDNLYFAKEGVSTRKFIVGDLIMVRPTELRFDPALRLKEDYAYTLDHWLTYGGAARCDYIAPSFAHYTNKGGAVATRTPELEQETIAYLKAKYPGMIRDNPRRPNEILLAPARRVR